MDNIMDKVLEICIKRGVNLDIAVKIFESENKPQVLEKDTYDWLAQTLKNT